VDSNDESPQRQQITNAENQNYFCACSNRIIHRKSIKFIRIIIIILGINIVEPKICIINSIPSKYATESTHPK